MTPTIRLAEAGDLFAVRRVVDAAYDMYVARIGRKPGPMLDDYAAHIDRREVHVLEADGAVAGLVVLIPEDAAMLLDNVAVDPRAQGKGYGTILLRFCESAARAAGYDTIRLFTHEMMTENLTRYARLGYVETHRATTETGLRRVFMVKSLSP